MGPTVLCRVKRSNSSHFNTQGKFFFSCRIRNLLEKQWQRLHTLKGKPREIPAEASIPNSYSKSVNLQYYTQAVNFGANAVNMKVLVTGLDPNVMKVSGSKKTVLTSTNVMDENSFSQPEKVKSRNGQIIIIIIITNDEFPLFLLLKI